MDCHRSRLLFLVIATSTVGWCLAIGVYSSRYGISVSAAGATVAKRYTLGPPEESTSPPVAVAVDSVDGNQHVFWRGTGGEVYGAWYDGRWHGPVSMGWSSASAPGVAVTLAGNRYVFWQGANGHIFEAWYHQGWSRPRDLTSIYRWGPPGRSTSAVAVAVNPGNEDQYLFWRGAGSQIYGAWYDGRWHRPVSMGWSSASAPGVAVTLAGNRYVFWQGANGHIFEAWYHHGWSRPRDLTSIYRWGPPGRSTSAVAVAVNPGNEDQYLFWRGAGSQIYGAWYDGRWHRPVSMGWSSASAPGVAVTLAGNRYVFWQGANGHIFEAWYDANWIGPLQRWSLNPGRGPYVEVVQTTADSSQRLAPLSNKQFGGPPPPGVPAIDVNDGIRYQRVTGVGAAMTDSSAWLIYDELSPVARATLMNDLFGATGIHLGFALVPMGASDFTSNGQPYTYDDMPAGQTDPQLAHFSIAHDEAYIIPTLRQMLAIDPQIEVFAVPWSPPAWMKANGAFDDLNGLGTLLPGAYQPLASYFVKFIQAYASEGVSISAIAPENEPTAGSPFPAMSFPEPNEAQWIAEDLQPALLAAKLNPKIYGYDNSWGSATYAQALISSQARGALSGIAWHCYGGIPNVMSTLQPADPTLDQLVTECAPNLSSYPIPEIVIGAMRNWASAVTLWNVALDPSGGPVQPPNYGCGGCSGIVTINEITHAVTFNLDYYQLGQIGTFVQPGAWRIGSNTFVSYYQQSSTNYGVTSGLDDVAFLNPDGSRVLLAYNNSLAAISFAVEWSGKAFTYTLAPKATVTFRWDPDS